MQATHSPNYRMILQIRAHLDGPLDIECYDIAHDATQKLMLCTCPETSYCEDCLTCCFGTAGALYGYKCVKPIGLQANICCCGAVLCRKAMCTGEQDCSGGLQDGLSTNMPTGVDKCISRGCVCTSLGVALCGTMCISKRSRQTIMLCNGTNGK